MSEVTTGRHRGDARKRHHVARYFGFLVLTMVICIGLFGAYTYRHLNENLHTINIDAQLGDDRPDDVDVEGPKDPLNILVMGSDTREGDNNIDGLSEVGERSDTTMLLHLSADRTFAYGVSLPRDAMVERPTCYKEDGTTEIPGGFDMWNAAFSYGGEACTVRQFEQLSGIRVDHFVKVDFTGFKDMVNAIGGVEICVPKDVDDYVGNIHLKAGSRQVQGQEALDYVRVRHNISANGDIGRMKRQQVFIASMVDRVMSKGVLARPDRLYKFLDAATKSLTLDQRLGKLSKLVDLGSELQDIGLDNIKFITVPWDFYEPDPNRLVWAEDANLLWKKIKHDQPLSRRLSTEVVDAAQRPGSTATATPDDESSDAGSEAPDDESSDATSDETEREATAAANGLCA
ncbi:LCP family glycopolymer transferase [Nocardioides alcanivorans]|uniref:LCP family glycopolymer transferase n=1 Tax=Nocardioides alcanivorans TaxID=2897352 RepID=UPI001F44EF1A|nr:LCP family protein [Nocardioides alcanivorans]